MQSNPALPEYGPSGYGPVPVENNLGWAIAAVLVCWPLGIPSLVKATQVQTLALQSRTQEAEVRAAEAKKWGKIAVILGGVLMVLYIVGVFTFTFLAMSYAPGTTGI